MIDIKKGSIEYELWLIRRNKRNLLKRKKIHRKSRKTPINKSTNIITNNKPFKNDYSEATIISVPNNFSLKNNTEEVVACFANVLRIIAFSHIRKGPRINTRIYFDLKNVQLLTIDAIMYIIAIIGNLKKEDRYWNRFSGNLPEDHTIGQLIIDSGFLDYVSTKNKNKILSQYYKTNDTVHIASSHNYKHDVAKNVCLFVHQKLNSTRIETQILYRIILEMINNVLQHAYYENSPLVKNWYLFARYENMKVCFTFLDTGEGIPNTLKKKLSESVPFFSKEYDMIYSALQSNRSNTQLPNRGKGLPAIYEAFMNNKISNLFILSGKGMCKFNSEDKENRTFADCKDSIYGTLYYWELTRENLNTVEMEGQI